MPLKEPSERFSLTEFGSLAKDIEDYNSDETFIQVKDSVPRLTTGVLSLKDIKDIGAYILSETSLGLMLYYGGGGE